MKAPQNFKVTITTDSGPCIKALNLLKSAIVMELQDIMGLEQDGGAHLDAVMADLRRRVEAGGTVIQIDSPTALGAIDQGFVENLATELDNVQFSRGE